MAYINHISGNFRLALPYGKKTLYYAYKTKDKEKIGHAYDIMASSFHRLGEKDSAIFYITKGLQFTKFISNEEKNNLLNNAAIIYGQAGNINKAKDLLKQSLKFSPDANAYGILAQVYCDEGKDDSATLLWEKALKTDNLRQKIGFLKSYAKWQKRNGKYEEASATGIKAAELKDSLARQQQAEAVKEIQEKYNRKVKEGETQRWIIVFLSSIIIMLIIVIGMTIMYVRTRKREQLAQREIENNRMMIADYTVLIGEMKKSGKEKTTEIKELQRRLDKLRKKQAEIIYKGKELYDSIKKGETTAKWNRKMFGWFVEYYRSINQPFVMSLEENYCNLSYTNMMFLILCEIEYKDNSREIGRIMEMEAGAMRTMKSRIKQKKRKGI